MTRPTARDPVRGDAPLVHVFIGTKAQYIKTAPLLREMDARGVAYRLIDSGQHAALSAGLRDELHVRAPDVVLGDRRDVITIPQAVGWAARVAVRGLRGRRLRQELFGGRGGICVVHGDTPSTALAALLARRAGLRVAHLEAGLRSDRLLHPFPEELVRRVVMRLAHVLFAPDDAAAANLRRRGLGGRTVPTSGNTVIDALRWSLGDQPVSGDGPVVATMHRVENLHRRERVTGFVALATRLASGGPVTLVQHGPTATTLTPYRTRLVGAGVELRELVPHAEFTRMLARAPLVVTDGGSIQEECALLGVPTLLWRAHTERPDGIGANVVLSGYDARTVDRFLSDAPALRRTPAHAVVRPSAEILDRLLAELDG